MMRLSKSYDLDDAEALERLRALTDYWWAKHGVKVEWEGATARSKGRKMGVKYDARVTVGDGRVVAEVEAGFLAEKLGAPRYVEGKLDDYLDPANTLESLRARIPT